YRIVPGQVLRLSAPPPSASAHTESGSAAPTPLPPPVAATHAPVPVPVESATVSPTATAVASAAPPVEASTVDTPVELPAGFQWQWPTAGSVLHAYAPASGAKGLDFTGNIGQPVLAAAPGRVVYSGNALKGYGELIIIKHDEQHLSAYGYNRKRYVNEGDFVTAGQPIGELGLGPENKPLLHFEIRERGKPVNPSQYLPPRASSG
ncbi:MAG TPA: peptidoglycan DD-metalloendopeptidase family protein, partial [Nevskiaceae bacterium]|nr:peptidoglycan DD-metalloendopeptidase family protein [Nevskiaceae bacterium]